MFSSSAHGDQELQDDCNALRSLHCGLWEVQRIVGRGGSGPLQEPDLVLPVGRRRVGVSGHDEGVADADGWTVQSLGQTADLVDDAQLVSGARERPKVTWHRDASSKPVQIISTRPSGSHVYHSTLTAEVCGIQMIKTVLFSLIPSTNLIFI